MKAIGGYFGLDSRDEPHYHNEALRFNAARKALEFLLKQSEYTRIHIPAYCCASLLEAFVNSGKEYSIYHIDGSLEITSLPQLSEGEAILYVNYFGVKNNYVKTLYRKYGHRLIVDNSQAFFDFPVAADCSTFYSPRKFFGVADGAYLYADDISKDIPKEDTSYDRMQHLLRRIDQSPEDGYKQFQLSEESLSQRPVLAMSRITSSILGNIDYQRVKAIRQKNFTALHRELNTLNQLDLTDVNSQVAPMVYPLLTEAPSLRKKLIDNRVFVPQYWPRTIGKLKKDTDEFRLQHNLIPLPLDQRYNEVDMSYIVRIIRSCI